MAAMLTSLVLEGIPERFPKLKIVFIEGGFGWIPSAIWRMDQHFETFRERGAASEAEAVGICEGAFLVHHAADRRAGRGKHLRSLIEWVGVDRLLFSSDYPHWDFDDPRFAFRTPLTEVERNKIFTTAMPARVYKL